MSVPILPESAPFSAEQRAWLNGFFAGLLGMQANAASGNGAPSGLVPALSAPPVERTAEETFPWHDPALPLEERLQLADGRPLGRRLMAAMAQLNCGACGYQCQTYGEALASGEEADATRCTPGGSDTARALKKLLAERSGASVENAAPRPAVNGAAAPTKRGTSRNHPLEARLIGSKRLTHPDSAKDTRHVAINLEGSGLQYQPGDSLGVLPENAPELVRGVLTALGTTGEEVVGDNGDQTTLADALTHGYALTRVRPGLIDAMLVASVHAIDREALETLLQQDEELQSLDVLELLERFPRVRLPAADFLATLGKLQPRLYSISSSQRAVPDEVHLTVGVVRWEARGRWRNGVASHFLGVRCQPGTTVRIFVQTSRFRLPEDPETPVIMVGPGTGIAPFRAFLQERSALGAKGRNWLLFGNQHFEYDFLYRDELGAHLDSGVLTRLDLAFSRDRAEKLYVQHLMRQNAGELWNWLKQGAHFYVCGDAKRMAADVHAALLEIVEQEGRLAPAEAQAYVQDLTKGKRYQRDVY